MLNGQNHITENISEGNSPYLLDTNGDKPKVHVGNLGSRLLVPKKNPHEGLE